MPVYDHNEQFMSPLPDGLPNTSSEACKELLLNMLLRKLLADDFEFVSSDFFLITCMYLGLDPETAVKVKLMFYREKLDRRRMESVLLGSRVRRFDEDAAPVSWKSWSRQI